MNDNMTDQTSNQTSNQTTNNPPDATPSQTPNNLQIYSTWETFASCYADPEATLALFLEKQNKAKNEKNADSGKQFWSSWWPFSRTNNALQVGNNDNNDNNDRTKKYKATTPCKNHSLVLILHHP